MKKYYLYTHFRPDTQEIFYIGIGTKNKQDLKYNSYTRAFNKIRRNNYWKNIVKLNPNYKVEIILESDDYEYIKEEEIRLIFIYGRKDLQKGNLCNMTNGGEGQINRIWSEESRKKLSLSKKGKKLSKETIERIKKHLFGNKSHSGRIFSKEHRKNLSDAGKGRKAWNKGIVISENHKKAIINGIKKNIKFCDGCNKYFDSANYSKWHGEKCLIGSIKEYIPEIQKLYKEGYKLYKISKILNIKYKSVYKLKENNLL